VLWAALMYSRSVFLKELKKATANLIQASGLRLKTETPELIATRRKLTASRIINLRVVSALLSLLRETAQYHLARCVKNLSG
jgi:hypothetical protein